MIYPLAIQGTLYPLGLNPGLSLVLLALRCIPCVSLTSYQPALELAGLHPSLSLASQQPALSLDSLHPTLALASAFAVLALTGQMPTLLLEDCDCD